MGQVPLIVLLNKSTVILGIKEVKPKACPWPWCYAEILRSVFWWQWQWNVLYSLATHTLGLDGAGGIYLVQWQPWNQALLQLFSPLLNSDFNNLLSPFYSQYQRSSPSLLIAWDCCCVAGSLSLIPSSLLSPCPKSYLLWTHLWQRSFSFQNLSILVLQNLVLIA